jgi:hypothetical protein
MLPSGPRWRSSTIEVNGFPTKKPITLFWKDSLQAAQFQFGNPILADHIVTRPQRIWDGPGKGVQYFEGVMTGNWVWYIQVTLILY